MRLRAIILPCLIVTENLRGLVGRQPRGGPRRDRRVFIRLVDESSARRIIRPADTFQEIRKGRQFIPRLRPHEPKLLHQFAHALRIKAFGIDVAHHVPETAILIEGLQDCRTDDWRTLGAL